MRDAHSLGFPVFMAILKDGKRCLQMISFTIFSDPKKCMGRHNELCPQLCPRSIRVRTILLKLISDMLHNWIKI